MPEPHHCRPRAQTKTVSVDNFVLIRNISIYKTYGPVTWIVISIGEEVEAASGGMRYAKQSGL